MPIDSLKSYLDIAQGASSADLDAYIQRRLSTSAMGLEIGSSQRGLNLVNELSDLISEIKNRPHNDGRLAIIVKKVIEAALNRCCVEFLRLISA